MDLAIVIVNYRTPKLVIDCLHSLQKEINVGAYQVIIVDNASNDGSVETLNEAIAQNYWHHWAHVLPSPINGGFSAGNNLGINAVNAKAYLLLNSDTIVRAGAIATLLEVIQAHADVGLVSPRLEWLDGTPQISCFQYHSPLSELIRSSATGPITKLLQRHDVPLPVSTTPCEPQWTSFACVLIKREVIETIGLLDEGYFMYFDDVDYCRRARNAGWKILHCPQARVVHLRGGSSRVKADLEARKRPRAYLYASRSRYFRKFYGVAGLWSANLFWLGGRTVSLARELTGNKQPHTCDREAQDIWVNWRHPLKPPSLT